MDKVVSDGNIVYVYCKNTNVQDLIVCLLGCPHLRFKLLNYRREVG